MGPPEPWCVRETELDDDPTVAASLLTLSNGYVGVRGLLDERLPGSGPGTLMAGMYEEYPQVYAEPGYGYPEKDERIVPVVDAWSVGLTVDGDELDVRRGVLEQHERVLDLRAGVLRRESRWTSPSGSTVEVTSHRLVSFVRREVVAVSYEVRAVDAVRVVVRPCQGCAHATPPDDDAAVPLTLVTEECSHGPAGVVVQRSPGSGTVLAVGTDQEVVAAPGVEWTRTDDDAGVGADLGPGQWLRVHVLAAYSSGAPGVSAQEVRDEADAALRAARTVGREHLLREQREYLAEVWDRADVVVEGDDEMQQALRFALFQVVQASARVEGSGVRVKGLTGLAYNGHTFWDADSYVLPVLDHALPAAAAQHLRWRHATLPDALHRASLLGLDGAAFPWRTISGRECSGYWPAGTAAVHINADVAMAAVRHVAVTGDEAFARETALDIVVHGARLWLSRGHHTHDGGFHVDGVTGPDEYSALVDDNVYTNLMARLHLRAAVDLTQRFPREATGLGVDEAERAAWRRAADRVVVPYAGDTGVTEQSAGFTRHARWDFDPAGVDEYPLAGHVHYMELYRRQVVKQADLVLALYTAGAGLTPEQKRRDFDYYEAITVRDSSLSAGPQAVVAAEVGHLELAYAYARETALVDLRDLRRSAHDGLHIGALAAAWTALVAGFGGLRECAGELHLAPRLPSALRRLELRLAPRDVRLTVDVTADEATYRLTAGEAVTLTHHGETLELTRDAPVARRRIPALAPTIPPTQPPGRAPTDVLAAAPRQPQAAPREALTP